MKQLQVSLVSETTTDEVSTVLGTAERRSLDYVLWKNPAQEPVVSFSALHDRDFIYLKYFVRESEKRATIRKTNGAVWEDSCVEFFISLDEGRSYFNFEFNCLGTKLAAFGTSKTKRRMLPVLVVETIKTKADHISTTPDCFDWNLFVAIPVTVFQQPAGFSLLGRTCRGNFYKCGDGLRDPHFLSWSNVDSEEPNFHLPAYFGEIHFNI